MAAIASAALGAAVLFEVVLRSTDGSTGVIVVNLAYPLGDILLLAAVIGVFALTGWRPGRTWMLIGAGLAATALADAIFLFQTATGSYSEGTILDALWPASMLFLAAAAWQPAARTDVELEGRPLLATPLVCGLIGLGIFTYDHFRPLNFLAASLAGATIIAVIVRTGLTFRENSRILDLMRSHAVTDALTGLGNRRRLVTDLDRALLEGHASEPRLLVIFDLDGFKIYNDTFGHPAGDALLARLAIELDAVAVSRRRRLSPRRRRVLRSRGRHSARGRILPRRGRARAQRDRRRLHRHELLRRRLPARGGRNVERRAARRRPAALRAEARAVRSPRASRGAASGAVRAVARSARPRRSGRRGRGRGRGVARPRPASSSRSSRLAARLHDVGKLAIPDAVLQKPGPLDVNEWAFIKEHVVIGERILAACAGLEARRGDRASHARALGRRRLRGRAERRFDPARRADHRRLRRASRR